MTAAIGLRERKRAQTRRRLEEAAIGLALRDGLDNVTIDAISERAEVSRRTFFNYFDSKDDAILGVSPPDVRPETLTGHLSRYADADLVESIIGLIIAVLGPSIDEPALTGCGWRSSGNIRSCSSGCWLGWPGRQSSSLPPRAPSSRGTEQLAIRPSRTGSPKRC